MSDSTQVRRVADELEIRNLVATLALMADRASDDELPDYAALFTEDAHWEMPGSPIDGREAILAGARSRRAAGTQGPGTGTRHVVTNHRVAVDGDTADGEAYFFLVASADPAPIRVAGHYRDEYRRTPDGWKMARRVISVG